MPTETFQFLSPEISQGDLATFAEERVNLRREDAKKYREQVANLRGHLERYMEEHPDIGLVKMQLSGSLAKGTALSTINDIDVAIYIKGENAPNELDKLLQWLVERLRTTFHQIPRDKIYIDGPCVVISYTVTGLNVDIAPIIYDKDPDWRGFMWDRSTGQKILTSIPLHLEFIRSRKEKQPADFAQVIRLLKWWVEQRKSDTPNFKMRSFLVELIMAHLADGGHRFDNYHTGLEAFFIFIQKTGLKNRIAFRDNYDLSKLPEKKVGAVEVFDPVNPQNNVASDMSESDRRQLVELSAAALDALSYARNCQTKADALACWRELMGSSFNA